MRIINRTHSLARAGGLTVLPGSLREVLLAAAALSASAAAPAQTAIIQFQSANYFVNETGSVATILVNRTGDTNAEASVEYSTDCGTAVANWDYEPQSAWLFFAPGEESQMFEVPVIDNSQEDGRRVLVLRLSNPSGATLGAQTNATLSIFDDEREQVPLTGLDNWTLSHWGGPCGLQVAYGNGRFIALGDGVVASSSDGRNWSAYSPVLISDPLGLSFLRLEFANGLFVALASERCGRNYRAGTILTSTDGILWTRRASLCGHILSDVTWGDGLFVAVGDRSGDEYAPFAPTILTSVDGINWVYSGMPLGGSAISYGNGMFVMLGLDRQILTSSNGVVWTVGARPRAQPIGVVFGNGLFVVVAVDGFGLTSLVFSRDGSTWDEVHPDFPGRPSSDITFGNGTFITTGFRECDQTESCSSGRFVMSSRDGIHWSRRQQFVGAYGNLAFGNGRFVLASGGVIFQSDPVVHLDLQVHDRAALTISGPVPGRYCIEAAELSGPLSDWTALTTLSLTNSPQVWEDAGSSNALRRYYRARLLP